MNPMRHYEEHHGPDKNKREPEPDIAVPVPRSDEHPAHKRQEYRRLEDVQRASYIDNVRNEPLTINKLIGILAIYFAVSQAVAQWRAQTVEPSAFKKLSERVDSMAVTVNTMAVAVRSLADELKEKKEGDNFFYYSICYSWKQTRAMTAYPAFCDKPEIQQFDPLGRPILPPTNRR